MDVRTEKQKQEDIADTLIFNFRVALLFSFRYEMILSTLSRFICADARGSVDAGPPSSSWVLRILLMFVFRTPGTLSGVDAYTFKDPKCSETDSPPF